MGRLILDVGGDESASILVAGSGRSGTTWLGEAVASLTGAREIFEPLLIDGDMDIAPPKAWRMNYGDLLRNYEVYIPADAGEASRYHQPLDTIVQGRMRNRWCDGDVRPGVYSRRVIKDIRANLALGYIARQWRRMKIVWIVRDPVAVVGSQMRMARKFGYVFDFAPLSVVFQPRLVADWLAHAVPAMQAAAGKAERLAHRWCVETMVPFWQGVHRLDNVMLVRYEDLMGDPAAWEPMLRFVGAEGARAGRLEQIIGRRSRTAKDDLPTDELSGEEISAIERIVEGYGASEWLGERRAMEALG
jgi:hypothetical protein